MAAENNPATESPASPSRGRRRVDQFLLLFTVVCLAGGLGLYLYRVKFRGANATVAVPTANTEGLEPAIVAAIEKEQEAVRRDPQSANAWGRLGMVFLAHDFLSEAVASFTEAERRDPNNPRWVYLHAYILGELTPADAIPKYQRAVQLCGDEPVAARLRLADTLFRLDHLEQAEQEYRRVLEHHPNNGGALLGLGRIAFRRGELQQALNHLRRSLSKVHVEKPARTLMAQIYLSLGNEEAAAQEQRRIAAMPEVFGDLDPFLLEMFSFRTGKKGALSRAATLLQMRRDQEVVALMQETLKAYPDEPQVWLRLGTAQVLLRKWDDAETSLRAAVKLGPDDPAAHFRLAWVLYQKKDYPAALAGLRKTLELKRDYEPAYFALGTTLSQLGDPSGAIEAFRQHLRYKPDQAATYLWLSDLLRQSGQPGEAARQWQQAQKLLQAHPADPETKLLWFKVWLKGDPMPVP